MPTVGDIINAMDGVVRTNTEQRAEIEAGKVLDHLHYFGNQVTPSFKGDTMGKLTKKE